MTQILDALPTVLSIMLALGVVLEALRRVLSRRSERRSAEADVAVKEANAFKEANTGWSVMAASWREDLAARDLRIGNLERDMQGLRDAREAERVEMQLQITRLQNTLGALRQQLRELGHPPVA